MDDALLVGVETASRMLGICPKTGRNWISSQRFPIKTFRLNGRRLVRRSDLLAFVNGLGGGEPLDPQPARKGRPRK